MHSHRDGVQLLSHSLSAQTPAYGGGEGLVIERMTSIAAGDSANTIRVRMPNHLGTHIDAPRHFFDDGACLGDFEPGDWLFRRPLILDVPGDDGLLIDPTHIASRLPDGVDLLLLRTGHESRRATPDYWGLGPGLSAELAVFLRETMPSVRAVGVDLVSITSRLRRPEGRKAHQAFLSPAAAGRPIMLIEDMALQSAAVPLGTVLVSPLFLEQADGGPVTVWHFSGREQSLVSAVADPRSQELSAGRT